MLMFNILYKNSPCMTKFQFDIVTWIVCVLQTMNDNILSTMDDTILADLILTDVTALFIFLFSHNFFSQDLLKISHNGGLKMNPRYFIDD